MAAHNAITLKYKPSAVTVSASIRPVIFIGQRVDRGIDEGGGRDRDHSQGDGEALHKDFQFAAVVGVATKARNSACPLAATVATVPPPDALTVTAPELLLMTRHEAPATTSVVGRTTVWVEVPVKTCMPLLPAVNVVVPAAVAVLVSDVM